MTGILLLLALLVPFTLFDLFHLSSWQDLKRFSTTEGSSLELECFFYTARIYSDYFLSYRPDAVWLSQEGRLSSDQAIRLVRMLWLPVWAVLGLLFIAGRSGSASSEEWRSPGREKKKAQGEGPGNVHPDSGGDAAEDSRSASQSAHSRQFPHPFRTLFLYLLIGYFLYRGSWQPWYFLWFLLAPGLWHHQHSPNIVGIYGPHNKVRSLWPGFFLSVLILFYLPVVNYRVDGGFDLSFFYIGFLLALLAAAMLLFYGFRRRKLLTGKKDI